jgi:hypothetical protein
MLADQQVNITDLRTKRTGDPGAPLYTMVVEVSVPAFAEGLDDALAALTASGGVEAHLAELETEVI